VAGNSSSLVVSWVSSSKGIDRHRRSLNFESASHSKQFGGQRRSTYWDSLLLRGSSFWRCEKEREDEEMKKKRKKRESGGWSIVNIRINKQSHPHFFSIHQLCLSGCLLP
jgi:hypothetical protein